MKVSWRELIKPSDCRGSGGTGASLAPHEAGLPLSFIVFLSCFGFLKDTLAVSETACTSYTTVTVGSEKLSLTNVLPAV